MKPRLRQPTRVALARRATSVLERLVTHGERHPHQIVLSPFSSGYARHLASPERPVARVLPRDPLR
jgi:hypothetical protein